MRTEEGGLREYEFCLYEEERGKTKRFDALVENPRKKPSGKR